VARAEDELPEAELVEYFCPDATFEGDVPQSAVGCAGGPETYERPGSFEFFYDTEFTWWTCDSLKVEPDPEVYPHDYRASRIVAASGCTSGGCAILAGTTKDKIAVLRYTTGGVLDRSYG
jgi:hypothetical protein